MTQQSVLVVGTGLIGTSIAIGLVAKDFDVYLSDADAVAAQAAADKSGAHLWDGQQQVDVVIVATPPAATAQVLSEMLTIHPNAVVTDVSSVKGSIFSSITNLDADKAERLIGSHPMAGREISGVAGAQSNLFVDRPWVITPTVQSSDKAHTAITNIALALGAVPIDRSISAHDRAVALISHTPQVVASVLARQLQDATQDDVDLAGQGIRDTIRLAGSNPELWKQILVGNSIEVTARLKQVAHDLLDFAGVIEAKNDDAIDALMRKGNVGRDRLPGKHGSGAKDSATLTVRVEDKPGELARLFAVAAASQVNLEDVRIDHSLGRMTGLVELSVSPISSQTLIDALVAAEFVVVQ